MSEEQQPQPIPEAAIEWFVNAPPEETQKLADAHGDAKRKERDR